MMFYILGFVVCFANILLVSSQTYLCEDTTDELSCSSGQIINVTSAFYGRQNATICPSNNRNLTEANCSLANATEIFATLCNGAQNCTLFFNGTASEDFCPNTTKYWSVNYECVNVSSIKCGQHEHYSMLVCDCMNKCQTPDFSCAPFCSSDGGCVCDLGYRKDPITGKCVGDAYCPQSGNLNQTHEEFVQCANLQPTCRYPHRRRSLPCVPGYQCIQGYTRDIFTSQCVRPDECPAPYRRWWK